MKLVEILSVGIFALFAMWMMGCTILAPYDRSQIGFWDQCIEGEGKGMSGVTQFGPWNVGTIKWRRNIQCHESMSRQVMIPVTPGTTFLEEPLAQTKETPPPDPCDWMWVYCR